MPSSPDGFTYSTTLMREDYRQLLKALTARQQRGSQAKLISRLAALAAVPLAALLALAARLVESDIVFWKLAYFGAIAILVGQQTMAMAFHAVRRRVMGGLETSAARHCGAVSFGLGADGVKASRDDALMQCGWSAVDDVSIESDGAVILWVGSLNAVRIPPRVFSDAADRDAAVAYVHSHLTSAGAELP